MSYQIIDAILDRHDADTGAAEAHGIASGMLCVDERAASSTWLNELFQDHPELATDEADMLDQIFEQTRKQLDSEGFEFNLCLPSDDAMLSLQVEALRNWCQGFLFGIGYAHAAGSWPGDSNEIVKDLVELTKIDTQVHDEDDEQAFVEITEYLRAAILLLRDDLRGNPQQLH